MNMIVENIPNMIFLKDAKELRFVQFNRAGEELLGYSRSDLLGKNDYDFFPQEQANFFTEKDRAVLTGSEIVDIPEEPLLTRNKGLRTLHTKKVALHNTKGEAEYLLGISEDITERKRAEEALLHRNQEMATLYETSLEINSLSDVSSLLKAIIRRACELLNIPSGALYLVRPNNEGLELVVAHQLPPNWVGIKIQVGEGLAGKVVQTQKPMVVEDYLTWNSRLDAFHDSPARRVLGVPLRLHDQVTGVIILVDREVGPFSEDEIRLASLFADQAAIAVSNAQFAAQLEDRVAQRTAELEAANRELEGLSYNIAHDMRSPVRAMVGYSGMLQQGYQAQLDRDGTQLVENIHVSGVRLGQMIDGFLTFLHMGHVLIHLRPINMDGLVHRLVNNLESELTEHQVEFHIEKLPECQADIKLIERVWDQLISNALKFTRPRDVTRIEIGSGEIDGKRYYFVRDNGVGFDMRYVDKLFGVFQKLHHETDFEGIGIGLAITRRIIQAHGGRIWAEAELNKGATFYFTLG
jgi:PAS domain S-box-containing protein